MKEQDIRPSDIFEEYLRLSALDIKRFFDQGSRINVPCPGCASEVPDPQFEKHGFEFSLCKECGSLYQTPRPEISQFESFYRDSDSATFWAKIFLPTVIESRRKLIVLPRVARIHGICQESGLDPAAVLDVGAGHGTFLEEWKRQYSGEMRAIEPNTALADICREKNIKVCETLVERANCDWKNQSDLVTSFEVIEHVHDSFAYIKAIFDLVAQNGIAVITGLGVEGFDIQLLWENSNSISPPHHLNFLSAKGYKQLFNCAGFSNVIISTPGELDLDIVKNSMAKSSEISLSRFEKTLLSKSPETLSAFQKFLQENCLSSHYWIVAYR